MYVRHTCGELGGQSGSQEELCFAPLNIREILDGEEGLEVPVPIPGRRVEQGVASRGLLPFRVGETVPEIARLQARGQSPRSRSLGPSGSSQYHKRGVTPAPRSANCARSPSINGAKRSVESSDAREPGRERDGGHWHRGLVDEPFRALHTSRRGDGVGRRPCVTHEEASQMSRGHPEHIGEIRDGLPIVEKSALDEPEGARDGRRRSQPRRRPGCRLRSTS